MKEVFLSRPNWLPENVKEGIKHFYNLLKSNELNPRTIGQSDYPNESPLDEVIKLMAKCEGTIILGVPQINIDNGKIKGENLEERLQLSTEWNHIEAALAHSLNQPLLIIHHKNVKRGIFDRGASNSYLHSVDMTDKSWPISDSISGVLNNWKEKLQGTTQSRKPNLNQNDDEPTLKWGMYKFEGEEGLYCPVCYQKEGLKIPAS